MSKRRKQKPHPTIPYRNADGTMRPGAPSPNPLAGRADQPQPAASDATASQATASGKPEWYGLVNKRRYLLNKARLAESGIGREAQEYESALTGRRPGEEAGIGSTDGFIWFCGLSGEEQHQLFTDSELFAELSHEKHRVLMTLLDEALLGIVPEVAAVPEAPAQQQRLLTAGEPAAVEQDAPEEPEQPPAAPPKANVIDVQHSYEGMTYADLSEAEIEAFQRDGWRSAPDHVRPRGHQIPSTRAEGRRESLIRGLERGNRGSDEVGANDGFSRGGGSHWGMDNTRGPGEF